MGNFLRSGEWIHLLSWKGEAFNEAYTLKPYITTEGVQNCKTEIVNGKLVVSWSDKDRTSKYEVRIEMNGKYLDRQILYEKTYSRVFFPASTYIMFIKRNGKLVAKSSNSINTAPTKIGKIYFKMEYGCLCVSWMKLEEQSVLYNLEVYEDNKLLRHAGNISQCNYKIERKFLSPSCNYIFKIWARSIHGNIDGESTCAEKRVGKIDIHYKIEETDNNITVTYTWKNDVEGTHFLSLPPGCEYKTMIEGNATVQPPYLMLRYADLWEWGTVKCEFIIDKKVPGSVVLNHVVLTENNRREYAAFRCTGGAIDTTQNNEIDTRIQMEPDLHHKGFEPSKLVNVKVTEKNGYFTVTWNESSNEKVQFFVECLCDHASVHKECTGCERAYKYGPMELKSRYTFCVWACSIPGNIDGEMTRVEAKGDGKLAVHYHIFTKKDKVEVDFYLDPCNGQHDSDVEYGDVSILPGTVYKCEIKGDVETVPKNKLLRHEDLWENRKVNQKFLLKSKSSDDVHLEHGIFHDNDRVASVPFVWKNENKVDDTKTSKPKKYSDTKLKMHYVLLKGGQILSVLVVLDSDQTMMTNALSSKAQNGFSKLAGPRETFIDFGKDVEIQLHGKNFQIDPPLGHTVDSDVLSSQKCFDKFFTLDVKYSEQSVTCAIKQEGKLIDKLCGNLSGGSVTLSAGSTTTHIQAETAFFGSSVENVTAKDNNLNIERPNNSKGTGNNVTGVVAAVGSNIGNQTVTGGSLSFGQQ